MGKVTSESPKETTTITHFSHPHPLILCNFHPPQTLSPSSSCAGCKLKPSDLTYSCTTCSNYFLHKKCFDMPKKITHPFHKDHSFTLLPEPTYSGGLFNCDACYEKGDGFSYNCKPCGIDLHILCAVMPLSISHASHVHKLELTFAPPYASKNFNCDICKRTGSNHWLYRCNLCEFDAHLKCARGAPVINPHMQQNLSFQHQAPVPNFSRSFTAPPVMNNPAFGVPAGAPAMNPYLQHNLSIQQIRMLEAQVQYYQAQAQAMQAGGAGRFGGGGGGGGGAQQIMNLISGMNNLGGGGVPGLNGFGGTGGLDFSSLLGGGGGAGGLDFSSLVGGGGGMDFSLLLGGGGGGMDFLGGVLGGFSF